MSKGPPKKLQRPLHRQRGRPRTAPPIRNTDELKAMLNCSKAQLPQRLRELGIDFHHDSAGNYWAALERLPADDSQADDSQKEE